jgi:TRAP-type mannitol/chloroaromatic compound transport system substrate-binding protein
MANQNSISFRALLGAVVTALIVGMVATLAIRPPGKSAIQTVDANATGLRERLHWRVPSAFGTNWPVHGDIFTAVAEYLESATDGANKLELFEPGELVPAFGITEAVRDRKTQAGFTWVGYDQGRIPASTLISSVPFGMEPMEFIAWWYEGGGRELGEALYNEHNVQPILCGVIGPETAGWFRKPVSSIDDFNGLKIRFAGLGGKVMQRLGASVTMMPGAEIFQALEKGAIDATEFSMPVIDQSLGFDRVAKFNYFPGWHQPFGGVHLLVNLAVWNELREDTRSTIRMACGASVAYAIARSEALQGPVIRDSAAKGVSAEYMSVEMLEVLRETTQEVLDEEAARDEWFARILEDQRTFSETYGYWKRIGYLPRDF